jgi:hypothetical protein
LRKKKFFKGKKLDKHGHDLKQGGGNHQRKASALQGCSQFSLLDRNFTRCCWKKKRGRVVADCLDMTYVSFGYVGVFSSSRLGFELFSLKCLPDDV